MPKILHFADAHIDMYNRGRRDADSGLPVRVLDFLKSLDLIVDTAIERKVDMVIFAGDAYKDRTPAPTFQREWGKRMYRLSQAGIPTYLLIGNHDLSPAVGRAHSLQEYETLQIPHVHVLAKPAFLKPEALEGIPVQLIAVPWVSKARLLASLELTGLQMDEVHEKMEERLTDLVNHWLEQSEPDIPVVLTAHASVQGAKYGGERSVMLGNDLVLTGSLVRDKRLSYVALGHIHKAQDLNKDLQPPVVYPGSIERVDYGEAQDDKFFVIAAVESGQDTRVEWVKIPGRTFIDRKIQLTSTENLQEQILAVFPKKESMQDAMVRLVLEYPREWDSLIDEAALHRHFDNAFEFQLVRRPQMEARLRLPGDKTLSSLDPIDLLGIYFDSINIEPDKADVLKQIAGEIISVSDKTEQSEV